MNLSIPARKMIFLVLIITAAFIAGGVILCFALSTLKTAGILPVSLGIFLSAVICVIKVFLLEYQVSRLKKMDDANKARFFAMGQGLLRFALTGGGLVAAYFLPFSGNYVLSDNNLNVSINTGNRYILFGAIAGAFVYNIAAYALRFMKLGDDEVIINQQDTAPSEANDGLSDS